MPQDSSDLVLHARQVLFALLLTSTLIVVGVFSEDSAGLTRAHNQAVVVDGLARHWNGGVSEGTVRNLARVIAGPITPRNVPGRYELTLEPLGGAAGHAPTPEHGTDALVRCTVSVDLSNYFFVADANPPEQLTLNGTSTRRSELSGVIDDHPYPGITSVDEDLAAPEDLGSFELVWDRLVSVRGGARIQAVYPAEGFARGGDGYGRRTIYSIAESKPIVTAWRSGVGDIGVNPTTLLFATSFEGHENAVVESWRERSVFRLAAGECRGAEVNSRNAVVVMPAEWSFEEFDWTDAWIERAIAANHLAPTTYVESRPFGEAFRDLKREAMGLESLDVDRLRRWLERRTNEERESVAVMGVSFSSSHLRLFGVLLIVLFQGFATLHLAAAAVRIAQGPKEDPGAFKPWILLYSGAAARTAGGVLVAAPTLAALGVVVSFASDGQLWSRVGAIAMCGVAVSGELTRRGLLVAGDIRKKAQTHRAAFGVLS